MNGRDYEQLTLSAADSLASHFPWLESKKERGTTVTYGRRCSELSESLRRVGSSVRTYLESCELPLTTFARTWSVKATKSGFSILKLRLSERRTGESGSRLWGTPNTMDFLPARSPDAMVRMLETARKGRSGPSNLREQVDPVLSRLWPTPKAGKMTSDGVQERTETGRRIDGNGRTWSPSLADAVKMWSTPQASDYRSPNTNPGALGGSIPPQSAHALPAQVGGQLNPTWVEWLMGYETGWTDLNASETP